MLWNDGRPAAGSDACEPMQDAAAIVERRRYRPSGLFRHARAESSWEVDDMMSPVAGNGLAERRHAPRKHVGIPVIIQVAMQPSELRIFPAKIDDISASGVRLTVERDKLPAMAGSDMSQLPFEMLFKIDGNAEVLNIHCALRRLERRDGMVSIGAVFDRLDPAIQRRLDAFLQVD